MRRIFSTRRGVLVGIATVMTATLTGLVWAAEPASPPPAAKAAVSGAGATASHVREVQEALAAAGYDPGPIDGSIGPRTKAALRTYISAPPPQVPTPADRALAPLRGTQPRQGP